MRAELRLFFNNRAADEQQLDLFGEVRVDQAMGMAWEAELHMPIGLDENGNWSDIEESFAQPLARVRVEAKVGKGGFTALIDGPVVGQRFELSAEPGESTLVLVVQDDSVALNRDEAVNLFESMSASDIASRLFEEAKLDAEVDSLAVPAGGPGRVVVQRGTPMALLRELARRHGMWLYVRPGSAAGERSVGVFVRPDLADSGLPEILSQGEARHCDRFSAQFDALRPVKARADSVGILDLKARSAQVKASALDELGDVPVHDLVRPGQLLLARTRETVDELEAAATAAVDHSAWAYRASGELEGEHYGAVLSPYRTVKVAGAGGYLAGTYLISQVIHVIDDEGYRQQFVLRRNARSDIAAGSGVIPGGIF